MAHICMRLYAAVTRIPGWAPTKHTWMKIDAVLAWCHEYISLMLGAASAFHQGVSPATRVRVHAGLPIPFTHLSGCCGLRQSLGSPTDTSSSEPPAADTISLQDHTSGKE